MRPLDPLLPSRWEILLPSLVPSQLGTPLHPLLPSRRGTPLHPALRVPSLSIQRTSSLANQVLLSMPDGYRLLLEMTYCAPNGIQSLPSYLPHSLIGLVTNRVLFVSLGQFALRFPLVLLVVVVYLPCYSPSLFQKHPSHSTRDTPLSARKLSFFSLPQLILSLLFILLSGGCMLSPGARHFGRQARQADS